jgi:hypothetical protein
MDEGRHETQSGPDPGGNPAQARGVAEPLPEEVAGDRTAEEQQTRRERFAEEGRAGDGVLLRESARSS